VTAAAIIPHASTQAAPTMFSLAKLRAEEGLWSAQTEIPACGPDDVLIRISRTAICGTDIHIYNWDDWAARTIPVPMVVGHEFSGQIVEIGRNVERPLHVGQRVSGEGHIIDLNSAAARSGRFHLDPATKGVGVNRPGAFAEILAIPAFNVVPLPEYVSDDFGALLDPLGNAVHTAQQFDLLGEDVLIIGAGPIGIMAAAVARRAGAGSVFITDVNPYRLDLATKLADVRPVNVLHEDLAEVLARAGLPDGVAVALEMSGTHAGMAQAIESLRMGGNLALLGIPSQPMSVNWADIIMKAITLKGVYGREMFGTWDKMLGLLRAGLDLSPLITHRFRATDFQQGFDAARSGEAGKVLLDWS
jgi:threonine 3-dehydrogenase|tara:strand:+ start:23473 stop:24552 length:1080 start_codon:yes stop_codon:yes gene_type:complete